MGACLHSLVFSLLVTLKLVSACLDGKRSVFVIISETFFLYIYIYSPLIRVFDDLKKCQAGKEVSNRLKDISLQSSAKIKRFKITDHSLSGKGHLEIGL